MAKNILLYVCYAAVIAVVILIIVKMREKGGVLDSESFQISMGMIRPQNKFYSKCVDDCFRNFTGDSSPGQFKWLCEESCNIAATNRVKAKVPDLTDKQFERHTEKCGLNNADCFCEKERTTWCREQWCAFSDDPYCMLDCQRTRAVNCESMYGGGLIM